MKAQEFPVRLHGYDAFVTIRLPKPMGGSAKIFLREVGKRQVGRLYHLPIETGISGRTSSGDEIPINTVGRWLFGTPGYMGHVRVLNQEGRNCKVEFPEDSPSVVFDLIAEIKRKVEAIRKKTK